MIPWRFYYGRRVWRVGGKLLISTGGVTTVMAVLTETRSGTAPPVWRGYKIRKNISWHNWKQTVLENDGEYRPTKIVEMVYKSEKERWELATLNPDGPWRRYVSYQVLYDVGAIVAEVFHCMEDVHLLFYFHLLPHTTDGGVETILSEPVTTNTQQSNMGRRRKRRNFIRQYWLDIIHTISLQYILLYCRAMTSCDSQL